MLKQLPEVGQHVRALVNDGEQYGEKYQTKGKVYEIMGKAQNGNPYFLDDNGLDSYLDEEVFDLYELVEDEEASKFKNIRIGLLGVEVYAENFVEEATDFSFKFKMLGYSKNTLKAIDNLQEGIVELLKSKYQ